MRSLVRPLSRTAGGTYVGSGDDTRHDAPVMDMQSQLLLTNSSRMPLS